MVARVLAFVVAACLAATGILPARDGYRCVSMNKVMAADDACPHCDARPMSIGNNCCERVRVGSLQSRAATGLHEPRIAPAPLTGALPQSPAQLVAAAIAFGHVRALPRGRPPGERLLQLSSILRV